MQEKKPVYILLHRELEHVVDMSPELSCGAKLSAAGCHDH